MKNEIVMETHRDPSIIKLAEKVNKVIIAAEELDQEVDRQEEQTVPREVYESLLDGFSRYRNQVQIWKETAEHYKLKYEKLLERHKQLHQR